MSAVHRFVPARCRRLAGLSLVELLVGIAVGLCSVAGALSLFAAQSRFSVEVSREAQVQRSLRQAMDFVTQDLRRAGAWEAAILSAPTSASAYRSNPHAGLTATATELRYSYGQDRPAGRPLSQGELNADEQFGLRLRAGVLESAQGDGRWQALTDDRVVKVTRLLITPTLSTTDASSVCASLCCDQLSAACAAVNAPSGCPKVLRWSLTLALEAESPRDPALKRRAEGRVQVRNELLTGQCPG